jgi:hypothetical protein
VRERLHAGVEEEQLDGLFLAQRGGGLHVDRGGFPSRRDVVAVTPSRRQISQVAKWPPLAAGTLAIDSPARISALIRM